MLGITKQTKKTARDYDLYSGENIDLTAQTIKSKFSGAINTELVGGDIVSKNTYSQLQAYNQYRNVADAGMTPQSTTTKSKKRTPLFNQGTEQTTYGN